MGHVCRGRSMDLVTHSHRQLLGARIAGEGKALDNHLCLEATRHIFQARAGRRPICDVMYSQTCTDVYGGETMNPGPL